MKPAAMRPQTKLANGAAPAIEWSPGRGFRISHAHNVTKRRWNLNLQTVHALVKGVNRRIRACTSCIRSGKVQKVA